VLFIKDLIFGDQVKAARGVYRDVFFSSHPSYPSKTMSFLAADVDSLQKSSMLAFAPFSLQTSDATLFVKGVLALSLTTLNLFGEVVSLALKCSKCMFIHLQH
jgi:hypothetical protein